MADSLYLSLWFPSFDVEDMLPHALAVMRQFEFSTQQPGVTYLALHPVSWNEPTILERRFTPGVSPEAAVLIASDLLHEDYAYEFEAAWGPVDFFGRTARVGAAAFARPLCGARRRI